MLINNKTHSTDRIVHLSYRWYSCMINI